MKKERNDIKVYVVFIGSLFLLGFVLFFDYLSVEVQTIETSFLVGDRPGFDLNKTALTFGQVVVGKGASRGVTFTNNYDFAIKIEILAKGEIFKFLSVSENDFILLPNESKELMFQVFPSGNLDKQVYSGVVISKIRRVLI